jgi:hypothetical protein
MLKDSAASIPTNRAKQGVVQQVRDGRGFSGCLNEVRCLVIVECRPHVAVEELKLAQVLRQFHLEDEIRRASDNHPCKSKVIPPSNVRGVNEIGECPIPQRRIAQRQKESPSLKIEGLKPSCNRGLYRYEKNLFHCALLVWSSLTVPT